ncbi:MAG: error-prone DNA polymerase [Hyphomonadaceae bacterium]|jgi:error-prone DNA polymerase|nr:error-prone DNA polymerase [Hyphomonadaceae bacterium]
MTAYAELAVTTNFSFLRGASHPQEMVATAGELGLAAIGIADRNSFAGVVRAYGEWQRQERQEQAAASPGGRSVKLLVGTRLVTIDGLEMLAYPTDRQAYGRLCRLLTQGNVKIKRGQKGECQITFEDVLSASEGQMLIVLPPETISPTFAERLAVLARAAPKRTFLAGTYRYRGDERRRLARLDELGRRTGAPLVAVNDVLYHVSERQPLADVLTCIREKCTISEAGLRLAVNAERHLKPPAEMARLFAHFPEAIARTVEIADACRFSLDDLSYEYPDEPVPPGKTPQQHLEELTWQGARKRYPRKEYPAGVPEDVRTRLIDELAIIAKLDYARYFLTVHDVVAFARNLEKPILCQGRGSAANSAVCYCLGITEVNPSKSNLLFARFISENRNEPPDIDVDFEHERREEVIQHIYDRYGRHRAAICATVIHYRSRRAIREVGKAMGLTPDVTAALAKTVWGSHADGLPDKHIREAGLDPLNPTIRQSVGLARELLGFPRHLSQHVGGFVLTRERLDETVPIANAAMDERTFIEWDKDDIATLKLMKVDVLALGMLSCLRHGLDLLKTHYRVEHALATIPSDGTEDAGKVYAMLSRADSVGVFQVESRAQMSMLPRLKPQCFYDLVIEVAIVRPGPIQGDMVHPYLRRRDKIDRVYYPSPDPAHGPADELENVLSRTLGVPLFQEQAMQIAIDAAKFTPDEADGLRRAMATFRHNGTVHLFKEKFIGGMTRRGYAQDFAERCFKQIEGFGEYGFPESHAASFALLVYASAWMKCRYPDVFCAAILNSQPMGFYQPAQLVRDARQHGVEVREVDVNFSDWDCTLERAAEGAQHDFAVRLGFRQVQGLSEDELRKLVAARGNGYASIERLAGVAGVSRFTLERLAEADAFRSLGLDRRAALWAARRIGTIGNNALASRRAPADRAVPLLAPHMDDAFFPEPEIALSPLSLSEHVAQDYMATDLSLKAHPVSFFRDRLARLGVMRNVDHRSEALPQNRRVTVAGLVLSRQMPGAKGVVFMTLEDETDIANIIVWQKVFARNRRTVMTARLLAVRGRLQRAGLVVHVLAESFVDLSAEERRWRNGDLFAQDGLKARPGPSDRPLVKSRDFH